MILSRPATIEELPAAYCYVDKFFGPGITPYEDVVAMQRKNNLFINIVTNVPSPATLHDVFGYFSLIPLTEEAHERIRTSAFYGKDMKAEHMPEQGRQASALYWGAIASKDHEAATLRGMFRAIAENSIPGVTPIYGRPVTEDGARLCGKLGFMPVTLEPDENGFQMFCKIAPLISR